MEQTSIKPSKWKIRFWRQLYKIYKSNKGASGILRHRISLIGYLVLLSLVLALAFRMGASRNTLFGMIAFLASVSFVSFVTVFFRRANVEVERDLPRIATVNKSLSYVVTVKNKSLVRLNSARLRELSTYVIPSEDIFVHSVEPGEESRNAFDRLFIVYRWKWLTGSRLGFTSPDSNPLLIRGRDFGKVGMELIPKRRGLLPLSNMRVILPDPFFLFQRCKKVSQLQDHILVLPERYRIKPLLVLGNVQSNTSGEIPSRLIGQSSEFIGLREYRPGDQIRHIDWKSWAKTGEPFVREYEDVFHPRQGLFLDTAAHPTRHQEFEEAVSVATSFACSIDTQEGLLDLFFVQKDTEVLTVGRGIEPIDKMVEVLACSELESDPMWKDLGRTIIERSGELTACILVFSDWSVERADLVNRILSSGVTAVCFYICQYREEGQDRLREFPVDATVHLLQLGKIQMELDRVLESA